MHSFAALFDSLIRQVEQRRRVALCTVVGASGSTPQSPGATLLLHENMSTEGTLGGGCVEAEVRQRAFEMLRSGDSGLLKFSLNNDYGWDDGLICGGNMLIAVVPIVELAAVEPFAAVRDSLARNEPAHVPIRIRHEGKTQEYRLHIEPPARLLIAGAGHVGQALAKLAIGLDFDVAVVDDRGDFANAERLPPPIRPVVGDIERTLREWPIDAGTYVVIVTRGHNHDEQALHAVIDSPALYLGMIGSKRKVKLIFDDLVALGVDPARLERVHSPIGLQIGSVTVPEIAISIAAELIQVRRSVNPPTRVEGPFAVDSAPAAP
ncbi:MAG: XdhC family protein [Phycisphaerae bacterium]|nr:XdhC family protein [Phycisphaerae bacterium]